MTKLLTAALAASVLWAAPVSAQSLVLVIGERPTPQKAVSQNATLDQKVELALDHACEKPFFRDLKGWQFYRTCRNDVRGEIEDKLAAASEPAAITIALR